MSSGEALVHDVTEFPPGDGLLSLGGGLELLVNFVDLLLCQLEHLAQQCHVSFRDPTTTSRQHLLKNHLTASLAPEPVFSEMTAHIDLD